MDRYKERTGDLADHVEEEQQRAAELWRKHNEDIDRRIAEERQREAKHGRSRNGGGNPRLSSGPSSTYGSDGGGSAFAGGSF
ncbi:hypothetical protein GCM10010403_51700 [Glycomyces rutgersensis]|uniref:Uncharacterized protein n=1 Tax=Glycomyces rutgersensis TaxID=58115 RepID=A0ABN3GHD3_9ACTN